MLCLSPFTISSRTGYPSYSPTLTEMPPVYSPLSFNSSSRMSAGIFSQELAVRITKRKNGMHCLIMVCVVGSFPECIINANQAFFQYTFFSGHILLPQFPGGMVLIIPGLIDHGRSIVKCSEFYFRFIKYPV